MLHNLDGMSLARDLYHLEGLHTRIQMFCDFLHVDHMALKLMIFNWKWFTSKDLNIQNPLKFVAYGF